MITTITPGAALFEGSTGQYTCSVTDVAGVAIPTAAIVSITADFRDLLAETDLFVDRNVFNLNGGTYDNGALGILLSPADLACPGTVELQPRRLTVTIRYSTDRYVEEFVEFYVQAAPA
jgi:hypothetical protein